MMIAGSTMAMHVAAFQGGIENRKVILERYRLEILMMTWRSITAIQGAVK